MPRMKTAPIALLSLALLAACGIGTDAATRLASDIEDGAGRLGREAGARYTITHVTPSRRGECTGPYKVQLDKAGAIVIWCMDEAGRTVSSHSTSYHARFVDTSRTFIVDKPAGSALMIDLERRGGRAVVIDAR